MSSAILHVVDPQHGQEPEVVERSWTRIRNFARITSGVSPYRWSASMDALRVTSSRRAIRFPR